MPAIGRRVTWNAVLHAHAAEPIEPAATRQTHQDRLGLILAMVRHHECATDFAQAKGERCRAFAQPAVFGMDLTEQQRTPRIAGGLLDAGCRLFTQPFENDAHQP